MLYKFISDQKDNVQIIILLKRRQYIKYVDYKLLDYLYSSNKPIRIWSRIYNNHEYFVNETYIYYYMDKFNNLSYKYKIKNTTQIFELHIDLVEIYNFQSYCDKYIIPQLYYISKYIPFIFITNIVSIFREWYKHSRFVTSYEYLIKAIKKCNFNNIITVSCFFGIIDNNYQLKNKYKSILYEERLKFKLQKNTLFKLINEIKYYFILYLIK